MEVVSDLLAQFRSVFVGCSEVDPAPDASVDDLVESVRQAIEAPRLASANATLPAYREATEAERGYQFGIEHDVRVVVPGRVRDHDCDGKREFGSVRAHEA